MSSEPYLICHLVRGQPAFDIAIHMCEGEAPCQSNCGLYPNCKDEELWIIPTSGHRAYPYWWSEVSLLSLRDGEPGNELNITDFPAPPGTPDHYTTTAARGTGTIRNLAERLGLVQKPTLIRRR